MAAGVDFRRCLSHLECIETADRMRSKPIATPGWNPQSEPPFWISRASRLLQREFDQALRTLGFSSAHFPVVGELAEHGELTQRQLLEHSDVEQPTMAALLARMERDGIVERAPHPTDKRAVNFSLSTKAKSRVPKARVAMHDVHRRALAGFTAKERTAFVRYLKRVSANLIEGDDGA